MLEFMHALEILKKEMRHSYISNGRQESVAEHSWRMAIMAFSIKPEEQVDVLKCIKMSLVHDLPEIYAGDVFAFDIDKRMAKTENEKMAMEKICGIVDNEELAKNLSLLWNEYEVAKTPEARFVKLLDKLEVLMQHNEADIETWAEIEKKTHFGLAARHSAKFGMLKELAEKIDKETFEKLSSNNLKPTRISQEEYDRYFGKK